MGQVADGMQAKLVAAYAPELLDVIDETNQHHGHALQNTKVNECFGVHQPGSGGHQECAAQNLRPAPPKPRPALPQRHRNGLPHASTKQKQTQNQGALPKPKRIAIKVLVPKTEVIEVKAKMEYCHPDHGQTAQSVHPVKSGHDHGHGVG